MRFHYRKIVNQHHRKVYSIAYGMLANTAEAEDATQEVFERVWKNMSKLPDGDGIQPWLIRITRNLCIDKLRQRRSHEELMDDQLEAHSSQQPSSVLAANQLSSWLKSAVAQLKDPYRSLVVMLDLQQRSVRETAQSLGLSENQTKVYSHRARKQLRQYLQGIEL